MPSLRFLLPSLVATVFALALARPSWAQDDRPVIVEYVAPSPECASNDAFRALLQAEIARTTGPHPAWRFSVRIRREDNAYEGTLTTETGVRTVRAARCDDVTAALAVI